VAASKGGDFLHMLKITVFAEPPAVDSGFPANIHREMRHQ